MSLIQIQNLTFSYPGGLQPIFQDVNLELDTNWRLGLIGRNGRGKTTLLRLLMQELRGTGRIISAEHLEYFPLEVQNPGRSALEAAREVIAPFGDWERRMQELAAQGTPQAMEEYGEVQQAYAAADGYTINESIQAETNRLGIPPQVLGNPFETLSGGERVKLLLAALFLKKHSFLLIDEPTDHLDAAGRRMVARWLAGKQGFILVSHDRAFLDGAVDHILSINRDGIELQRGNYSSWRHNRDLRDRFEQEENAKLEASIARLEISARRAGQWSGKVEKTKQQGRSAAANKGAAMLDKGYIGHQAARMMKRAKSIERRKEKEIQEKKELLKNIESADALKFSLLPLHTDKRVRCEGVSLCRGGRLLFENLSFTLQQGERLAVTGPNGCGKSSLLKLLLQELPPDTGSIWRPEGLQISTLPQETDFLQGGVQEYARRQGLELHLFLAILRKLDFEREAFDRDMRRYSAGQKKKVCLAASLARPAHLFIWDEPLNYVDLLSREQIQDAVLASRPALIFVEHDAAFVQAVATGSLDLC